ncbi:unnamed protein product [Blepharisma stoltei]|uniref:U-box domain-containing protein n=1 Tax=Blepharisma stoltei TaxID=1481888 RepID=A0AAU9JZT8_9CILI|nr:unnamed protein product [Blepharisma stoltei]
MVETFVDIPDDYCCPITGDIMEDPVVAPDGHSYERASITAWFQKNKTSPLTGAVLKNTILIDNHRLKAIITSFKERLPEIQRDFQIKRDLLEAINIREAFFQDHLQKEKEQIGNITTLHDNEKEKNLLLKNKLTACKKFLQVKTDQIDTLQENLDNLKGISESKNDENKRLHEDLTHALAENDGFKRVTKLRFESIFEKLLEVQENVKQLERVINSNKISAYRLLTKLYDSISKLINEADKNKRELEDRKEVLEIQRGEWNLLSLQSNIEEHGEQILNLYEPIIIKAPDQPDIENKLLAPQELKNKKYAILSRVNDPISEEDFRKTCSLYDNDLEEIVANPQISQAYQDYIVAYHQNTSLYFTRNVGNRTHLIVYDTESEREEIKVVETPEPINNGSCMAQLPDGELFCFGNSNPPSGISWIIDGNYGVRILTPGKPCYYSSAVYFNRNVYCFGGLNNSTFNFSEKFNLDENQWVKLSPMPQADALCSCIVIDGNILISGYRNKHLLKYSIENNSFARISYEFLAEKRKILLNAEKLYLIECSYQGFIYESRDETSWRQIVRSKISYDSPAQIYCAYNKGAIYIGIDYNGRYKFNLDQKMMIKL